MTMPPGYPVPPTEGPTGCAGDSGATCTPSKRDVYDREQEHRRRRMERDADDYVVDITRHDEDTLFTVRDVLDAALRFPAVSAESIIVSLQNAGILFRERAADYDPVPAESENAEMATAAEEPIEQRLMRAFLNGWREGFERAQWGSPWDR